jgi:hypothetical protein
MINKQGATSIAMSILAPFTWKVALVYIKPSSIRNVIKPNIALLYSGGSVLYIVKKFSSEASQAKLSLMLAATLS